MQPDSSQPSEQPRPENAGAQSFDAAPQPARSPIVTMAPDQSATAVTSAAPTQAAPTETQPVRWQATEYIHREKNGVWFAAFAVVTLLLVIAAIFFMKSLTFAILVPVMAMALLVYTQRPPRVIDYTLSRQGLHVNDRLYPFSEFKSFAVIHGDEEYSIMLIPTKRFRPGVSVYFPEEAGEAIVDMLAARLPMQEMHIDIVDQLIQKLRI